MGKTQDGEGARPVKREVVSASANLEVISEENFARRLQGMSACINCQRERFAGSSNGSRSGPRHHNNSNNNKQGRRSKQGRRKPAKANTPIVIHLKDTLRSVLQQRQRSFDTDSDVSVRSTDDDLAQDAFGDVSSIPEFIPQYMHHHQPQQLHQPTHSHSALSHRREKSKKNLTAFISVIEKAHQKDSCNNDTNLSQNSNRSKLSNLLNNAVSLSEKSQAGQRSIIECDNVDLICNDLHKKEKSAETLDDTDSVSDKSSISSSSEAFSDSDSQVVEENAGFEFTPEELERLAEYTTGFPLYRYDCAPSECPECLTAWYSHQVYQYEGCSMDTATSLRPNRRAATSLRSRKSSTSHNESEHDTTLEASDNEEEVEAADRAAESQSRRAPGGRRATITSSSQNQPKSPPSSPTTPAASSPSAEAGWPWRKGGRQLWDIDILQSGRRSGQDHRDRPYTDSVYLDLTGTDVSISVYYHHSLLQDEIARSTVAASVLAPTVYTTAASSLYSVYYSSFIGSPVYGLSLPLSLFNDNALPKIAMVPPHELKKFTTSAPPQRQWIVAQRPEISRPSAIFTVMCYNVLCDKYCTRQQYGYCPVWALNWEYRKKGIIDDIRNLNGDIISLQEVETDQFFNFFLPELKREGYDGIFSPKSRARTMTEHERKHVDGCAIFFKKAKFSLVEEKLVEFNQLAMANAEGSDDMLNRVMTKDNIGLAALLETKPLVFESGMPPEPHTRQLLLVATAHIHWDPEFSDVKLVQTMMLMWELQKFVEEASRKYQLPFPGPYDCNSIPLLFCGDLNSLPDSGVIEYLTNGRVAVDHEDFKENVYDKCMRKMSNGDKEHVYHNFRLARAYSDVMPVTNFTYDFKGIIDYIFHSRDHLSVLGMLGPYDEDWFRQNKILGCPHPHIPSDHFSLFVEMELAIRLPPPGRGPPLPALPKPR